MFKAQFEDLRKKKQPYGGRFRQEALVPQGLFSFSAGSADSSLKSPQFCPQIP